MTSPRPSIVAMALWDLSQQVAQPDLDDCGAFIRDMATCILWRRKTVDDVRAEFAALAERSHHRVIPMMLRAVEAIDGAKQ